MVSELLQLLRDAPQGLTVLELSRRLHAQPSAVAGMLEWLTNSGRLLAVGPDGGVCGTCGQSPTCQLMALHGVRYIMARRESLSFRYETTQTDREAICLGARAGDNF